MSSSIYQADQLSENKTKNTVHSHIIERGQIRPTDRRIEGLKPKDLVGIPWRVAFALQADGWFLRSDIIWNKPNPLPESVKDRPTRSHEYVFLLSKSKNYFYNYEAALEPLAESTLPRKLRAQHGDAKYAQGVPGQKAQALAQPRPNIRKDFDSTMGGGGSNLVGHKGIYSADGKLLVNPKGRNMRSVWTIVPAQFRGGHFATFPPALVEKCLRAGCPEGGTVLDPFGGAGTTGLVALRMNMSAVLIELNPDYCKIAQKRIVGDAPMLNKDKVGVIYGTTV